MKKSRFILTLLFFLFIPGIALSANHYIRTGATGANNGSDWTNAWTSFSGATWTKGDTYYVAAGNYGSVTFGQANSGSSVIYIKKATSSSHGTDTGWNSSYGSGQATFTRLTFTTDYWDIDGQEGGGPGTVGSPMWSTGHGFLIKSDSSPLVNFGSLGTYRTGLAFRHIEITSNTKPEDQRIFQYDSRNSTYEYLYMHDIFGTAWQMGGLSDTLTIQYCYIKNFWSTAAVHEEPIADWGSDNIVVRWNLWENIKGTAVIAGINGSAGLYMDNWEVYGNVFYCTDTSYVSDIITIYNDGSNHAIARNWKLYNNSIIKWKGRVAIFGESGSTGNIFKNNVVYQGSPLGSYQDYMVPTSSFTRSYNYYSDTWFNSAVLPMQTGETPSYIQGSDDRSRPTGNPFVSIATYDFRLTAPLSWNSVQYPGDPLGTGYNNKDWYGNTRGADGVCDRGAIEYLSGTDTAPSPPNNLKIIIQ